MHVDVYLNLNMSRPGAPVLSIRHRGLVIGHARAVRIDGATFPVQPAGRQRVLDSGVKNVHAFVRGELVTVYYWPENTAPNGDPLLGEDDTSEWAQLGVDVARLYPPRDVYGHVFFAPEMRGANWKRVTYNPRRYETFVLADDPRQAVTAANHAIVDGGNVWIKDKWIDKED